MYAFVTLREYKWNQIYYFLFHLYSQYNAIANNAMAVVFDDPIILILQ